MRINENDIEIINATIKHADDWSMVFMNAMKSFRWMNRYIKEQNISEIDVSISFSQDVRKEEKTDRFLIAYYLGVPVGILRMDEYLVPKAARIISHFPLVRQKYQRKGIGKMLVKAGVQQARKDGLPNIWSECWSKDPREVRLYQSFYERLGFVKKSNRLEMICNLKSFNEKNMVEIEDLEITKIDEITDELVEIISLSYAQSQDKLHIIENLGNPKVTNSFLRKTKQTFLEIDYKVESTIAKLKKKLCAGLLTATSKNRGMILEIGVIPGYRNQQIAQCLIENYLIEMKKRKNNEVALGVDEDNFPAISLYKKLGFNKSWKGILMLLEDEKKLGL